MTPRRTVVSVLSIFMSLTIVACIVTSIRYAWSGSLPKARATPSAPVSGPAPPRTIRAEGRVIAGAGGQVTASAQMLGTVAEVLVAEGEVVEAGQALAVFRRGEHAAAASESYALRREADATARFLDAELKRTRALVASGALPKQELDKLVFEQKAARAKLGAAAAAEQRSAIALGQTRLVAPIAGTVISRKIERGETVPVGTPLFVIADLTRLRVVAEVDEFDALAVAKGMRGAIIVDGYDGAPVTGAVSEIGAAIVPRRIRPQDPTRPTEPQVLEVKLALDGASPFKLGQRVSVTLERAP